MDKYDVVVIGGGPAGLAAGLEAKLNGAKTVIIEREKRLGGILKQCIHDGFGLIRFKERLSGPEYAENYVKLVRDENIPIITSTFVLEVKRNNNDFEITLVNSKEGIFTIVSKTLILANGCRERTAKQVFIHGARPAGIFTAGSAQYLVNILGYLPCKKCVILGSGDIGLIMARRLTLEGAKVLGVYEAKSTPSGLQRNIAQCLEDYSIPLHLSRTITRIYGEERVNGVEICEVDEGMKPIKGKEEYIECDGVILSVGLIPENEIAESMGVLMDKATKGPVVDQNLMTSVDGAFSCGNALHVNDLVDYVSESGKIAGASAASYAAETRKFIPVEASLKDFLYVVPQRIDMNSKNKRTIIYFRSREERKNIKLMVKSKDKVIFEKSYRNVRPPEMERIEIDLGGKDYKIEELNISMLEG